MCNLKGCGFPQRHKCKLCSIYDPKPTCANNELSQKTNRLRKRTIKTQVTLGWRVPLVYWFKVELQNRHTCVNIDIIKGMIKCVLWNTFVHSDLNCGRLTVWSKVTVLSTSLKQNNLHQMVDLEKDTLRWWFSPRSWLWNLIRDSIASSTEPNWMRAILRSFLKGLTQYFKTSRKYGDNLWKSNL